MLTDETKYLEQLMEAQQQLREAAARIDDIAMRCHFSASGFSQIEKERVRHQARANAEATWAAELEEAAKAVITARKDPRILAGPLFDRIADLDRMIQAKHGAFVCAACDAVITDPEDLRAVGLIHYHHSCLRKENHETK